MLITQNVPHYRLPIYELLCSNVAGNIDYSLIADEHSHIAGLKVLSKAGLTDGSPLRRKWRVHKNFWIGGWLLWQRNVFLEGISMRHDVVIMTGDARYLTVWLIALVRRITRQKTLLWTHGLLREEHGLKKWIRLGFYKLANGLLLYGHRAKKLLSDSGMSALALHVIYNSLDYSRQCAIYQHVTDEALLKRRAEIGLLDSEQVIITSGRLMPDKKIDWLIRMLPRLQREAAIRLLIIGDGPELYAMKRLADAVGQTDQVVFYGACYQEEVVAELMRLGDLFVLPGNAGLSVIHALTYGLPVITHDDFNTQKPEVEAISDGQSGAFYRAGDMESMTQCIKDWLLRLRNDKAVISNLCQSQVAQRYSPQAQLDAINNVVLEVLDNDRSGFCDPMSRKRDQPGSN